MTALPDLNREAVRSRLAQQWSRDFSEIAITKADLRAAVNAIDDYFNTNAATINQVLPEAARTGLTQGQKAYLLTTILEERYWEEV